jgi:DNA-binding response OmpR family regulator
MKTVIIAEDIKTILEKEQSFLDRADIRSFTVSTNKQAFNLHRAEKADLIIVNLESSEMSGDMLCSLIREDKELCKVSIIILSSNSESDDKRCLQCRANAFITSPPDKTILLQEMHQLLSVAPRKTLRVPLSIKIHVASKWAPFIVYAENISVSGMLLHSEAHLSKGDTITCSFYLPDSTHITINAEVTRVVKKETEHDTNCYGVRFIDPSIGFSSAIEAFVEKKRGHKG